jgi:hypothetical protein
VTLYINVKYIMRFETETSEFIKVKVKRLLMIGAALTMAHFSLSLYVSYQIGSVAGRGIAGFVTTAMDRTSEVDKLYNEMKQQTNSELKRWYPIAYAMSLPLGPVTDSWWREKSRQAVYDPVLRKEKSASDVKPVLYILAVSEPLLNSIAFSVCIMGIWFGYNRISGRDRGTTGVSSV